MAPNILRVLFALALISGSALSSACSGEAEQLCDDAQDNDGDAYTDCEDQDCWSDPDCSVVPDDDDTADDDDTSGDDDDSSGDDDDSASSGDDDTAGDDDSAGDDDDDTAAADGDGHARV